MTADDLLFDLRPDWSATTVVVREAPVAGPDWILKWHYSALKPSPCVYYGAYLPDLAAVVAVGQPAGNKHGVAARVGLADYPGNLEITRVVCHPDAPKNTASRAIAAVLRYVRRAQAVDWVYSFADLGQGHHGGIYQALNAVYVGLNGPARHGYRLDGVRTHPRTVVHLFGTSAWPRAAELAAARGRTLERIEGRYHA